MLFDYETLKVIWWLLVGLLLVGFAIMDGHDMGVGALLPFVGQGDEERRVVINTVGPHWDGNQVWFITAGGALFAAWPLVYATAFSGFYWAMLSVLWALFLRPVGFDYRSKIHHPLWRQTWDWGLFIGGIVPPLVFGIAFGNLLQGVPFYFDDLLVSHYTGSFADMLNPFALLSGGVASAMIIQHGGVYLAHRTEGDVQRRSMRAASVAGVLCLILFAGAGLWLERIPGYVITSVVDTAALPDPLNKTVIQVDGAWLSNFLHWPWLWLLPTLTFAGTGLAIVLGQGGRTGWAFVASSLSMAGIIGTAGAAMFPFVMPSSTHPNASLTAWDSVSSPLTLSIMLVAAAIFIPLIVVYTSWAYRVMRGKVTVDHIRRNAHSAY
ncbi:MAG: cytochrome d ubiquinol oxidase subunit II [Leptothrix ochracea]|uniref:cytochrome d ubiquinol oxidase subunit II n=1 Tax=Leptothrix ochracea TaxID=735331 RepID=UPI0034E251C8